jgi:hypothetical protein
MPVAQSPAHYINSSKGCPSITESFPLCCLLVHKMSLLQLLRHCQWRNPYETHYICYVIFRFLHFLVRASSGYCVFRLDHLQVRAISGLEYFQVRALFVLIFFCFYNNGLCLSQVIAFSGLSYFLVRAFSRYAIIRLCKQELNSSETSCDKDER